jgi:asparagine synthase (glutamine-hydrolysing)
MRAGNAWLAFNGEVYESDALRARHGLGVGGDTGALLHALLADGPAVLDRLHAMYALALWEPARGSLLLARDLWGQKPLYVAHLPDGGLAFASEPKALRSVGGVDWSVDAHALHLLLRHGYIPGERTG